MQDFMDLTPHHGEGTEFDVGWRISSPLMLSPSNEMSNPFFAMMNGELSQTLKLDLGMISPSYAKPRLTPSEFTFSRRQEEFLDFDYFGLDTTTFEHNSHPTRLSSASLESTASSCTPSEADSDLIERASQEEDTSLLNADMASCSFPMTPNVGLGFHVGYVPSTRSTRKVGEQVASTPSQATLALNTFNLSDFISDQEQEQYHGHQQQQQQQQFVTETRPTAFITPDRPLALHDLRMQAVRSVSYSPISNNSPLTPDLEGGHFKPSTLRSSVKREYSFDGQTNGADGLLQAQGVQGRPRMPMRAYTDSTAEILSCNPAQITPSHAHLMEKISEARPGYFYSMRQGQEAEQNVFNAEDYSTSPTSLYSSPSQEYHNLWSSIEGSDTKQDVFDGNSSPLFQHHQDGRAMSLAQSATSPQTHERKDSADYFAPTSRVGAMRNARLSAMAASRRSSLPYESPLNNHTRLESLTDAKMIASMPGIITKRSRGRRVPSNPEELSNLGKSGKVYTCKVPGCGKCFKRSEHLKRHVRSIHTNEKPFTCHCGKTFSRHDNLNQHARVHTMDGEDGSASESASVSPATSPTSLPGGFVGSQPASFSLANSRLRKAVIADEEDCTEANMFA